MNDIRRENSTEKNTKLKKRGSVSAGKIWKTLEKLRRLFRTQHKNSKPNSTDLLTFTKGENAGHTVEEISDNFLDVKLND